MSPSLGAGQRQRIPLLCRGASDTGHTQHALYTSIIRREEIDAAHDGAVPMRKTREHGRANPIGLLVAVVGGHVVGGASKQP